MKRLIILFLAINSIFCSIQECAEEEDYSKCSTHTIDEIKGHSCRYYVYNYHSGTEEEEDEDDEEKFCQIFPDSSEDQQVFWKLENGDLSEIYSVNKFYVPNWQKEFFYFVPKQNYFEKDENIEVNSRPLTEDEINMIGSENTCLYQILGRVYKNFRDNKLNITDKNICFNTNQFPDLKDLVNCGYGTIKLNISNNIMAINTCFFIPDNNLPVNFNYMFKKDFVENLIVSIYYISNYGAQNYLNSKVKKIGEKLRKLQDELDEDVQYEVEVEDKFGKKYRYTRDKYDPEIIEEGLQGNQIYNNYYGSKTAFPKFSLLLFIISLILF